MKQITFFIFILFNSLALLAQSPYGKVLFLDPNGAQKWDFLPPQSLQNAGWALTGNDLTSNPNWFFGTISNHPLNIFTNNTLRLTILNTGNVGSFGLLSNNGINYVGFAAPTGLSNNIIFTLPGTYGSSGQFLATDGFGNLYWASALVGSVPFSQITSGTNTSANMIVGSGATLTITGTGVIEANKFIAGGTTDAVDLNSSEVAGILPISNGGTGATTANAALNNLLPSQSGNAGKFLQTDGSNVSWASALTTETDPQVGTFTTDGQVARWNNTGGYLEPGIISDWGGNVTIDNSANNTITIGGSGSDVFNVYAASTFNGNITVAGNVLPSGTNRTLGSSTAYWDEIYVDDNSLNFVGTTNSGVLQATLTSTNRTWTLPDASGTILLNSDIGVSVQPYNANTTILGNTIDLNTSEVAGTLPISNGGTGATTANAALNNLLPSQSGNAGKFLQTDGSNVSWASALTTETDPQVGTFTTDGQVARWNNTGGYLEPGIISDWGGNVTIDNSANNTITIGGSGSDAFNVNAASTFNGNITVAGNVLPSGPNRTLGSPTAYWDEIYVDNNSVYFVDGTNLGGLTTNVTGSRTWTLPDASGTVITTGNLTDITAVGTITSGTWNGSVIGVAYGGTGFNSYASGDIIYASGTTTLSKLSIGTNGQVLAVSSGAPAWTTLSTLETDPVWTAAISANTNITGNWAFQNNLTIGSDASDNVVFNADVNSNIIPNSSATFNLGSSTQLWNTVYANGIRAANDGFRLIHYPGTTPQAYFDILDITTNQPVITAGPAIAGTASEAGIRINERSGGNLRAGMGWNTATNSWSVGVGDLGGASIGDEFGVYLNYATNSTNNEVRIAVANGNITTPVFLVDREGDLTAASVTTGNLTANDNVILGSDASDNVEFNADVNSNIIPNTANAFDLGSTSQYWRSLYVAGSSIHMISGGNSLNLQASPSANRTITLPDVTGTIMVTSDNWGSGATDDYLPVWDPNTKSFVRSSIQRGANDRFYNFMDFGLAGGGSTPRVEIGAIAGTGNSTDTLGSASGFVKVLGRGGTFGSTGRGVAGMNIGVRDDKGAVWVADAAIGDFSPSNVAPLRGIMGYVGDIGSGFRPWVSGIGNFDLTSNPNLVMMTWATSNTSNEPRLLVVNGNLSNPVFLVDREGDLIANTVTTAGVGTGGLTINNQSASGISFQIANNGGAIQLSVASYSSNATLNDDNVVHIITGGTSFSFPANVSGKVIIVVNTTGSAVTIGSFTINSGTAAMFVGNGTNWYRIQ